MSRGICAATMSASNEKDLFKVIKLSTALAFGALLASLESLRSSAVGFSFQLSYRTLLAFLIGGALALAYWSLVLKCGAVARRTGVIVGTIFLALFGIGAFLYPLRFVPRDKLPDILIGLGLAACALSGVGGLLWGARKFLNADSQATDEKE